MKLSMYNDDCLKYYNARDEHIENYLRGEIAELASEKVKYMIGAYLTLMQKTHCALAFRVDGTDKRVVNINYRTRVIKIE